RRQRHMCIRARLRTCEFVDNRHTSSAEQLLGDFADTIGRSGSWIFRHAQAGIIFCPEHAQQLAAAGYDRARIREWIAEHAGRTTAQLARAGKDSFGENGVVRMPGPPPGTDGAADPGTFQRTLPSADPKNLLIAVAGARNAGISMVVRFFADWSGTAVPVAARRA
ncbi:MAG: hypothetical protein IRZ08_17155, partial [Frankia sp.]|nr:hypothetical protein [Frankia sp.]